MVHQLKVKVDGWEETAIPISVDKIGIFFRDLHPSIGSSHGPVRLVFAISLSDTRKVVNVRSGLVIHNTLELPMEVKLDPPAGTRGIRVMHMYVYIVLEDQVVIRIDHLPFL